MIRNQLLLRVHRSSFDFVLLQLTDARTHGSIGHAWCFQKKALSRIPLILLAYKEPSVKSESTEIFLYGEYRNGSLKCRWEGRVPCRAVSSCMVGCIQWEVNLQSYGRDRHIF